MNTKSSLPQHFKHFMSRDTSIRCHPHLPPHKQEYMPINRNLLPKNMYVCDVHPFLYDYWNDPSDEPNRERKNGDFHASHLQILRNDSPFLFVPIYSSTTPFSSPFVHPRLNFSTQVSVTPSRPTRIDNNFSYE